MFIKHDNEQCLIPVRAVPNCRINAVCKLFAFLHVRNTEELNGMGFRMHVVLGSPFERVHIIRLDKGVTWQSSWRLRIGFEIVKELEIVQLKPVVPHPFLGEHYKTCYSPPSRVDLPLSTRVGKQVVNCLRLIDEDSPATLIINVP